MSRLLVCPPDYFSIDYEINPWMRRSNAVNSNEAVRQWHHLMQVLEQDVGAVLERMKPVPGLPDLVFTANAGIVVGRRAVASRFRYAERRKEEAYFEEWFRGGRKRRILKNGFVDKGTKSSHWIQAVSSREPGTSWDSPTPGSAAIGSDRISVCSRRLATGSIERSFHSN